MRYSDSETARRAGLAGLLTVGSIAAGPSEEVENEIKATSTTSRSILLKLLEDEIENKRAVADAVRKDISNRELSGPNAETLLNMPSHQRVGLRELTGSGEGGKPRFLPGPGSSIAELLEARRNMEAGGYPVPVDRINTRGWTAENVLNVDPKSRELGARILSGTAGQVERGVVRLPRESVAKSLPGGVMTKETVTTPGWTAGKMEKVGIPSSEEVEAMKAYGQAGRKINPKEAADIDVLRAAALNRVNNAAESRAKKELGLEASDQLPGVITDAMKVGLAARVNKAVFPKANAFIVDLSNKMRQKVVEIETASGEKVKVEGRQYAAGIVDTYMENPELVEETFGDEAPFMLQYFTGAAHPLMRSRGLIGLLTGGAARQERL